MNIKQKTGLAIGAGVIGIGAALGVAWAVTGANTAAQAQGTGQASGRGEGRGPGGLGNLASALAEKLGVEQSKITEAIQSALPAKPGDQASPGARASQGTGNRATTDVTLAKAIAEKLGIDEATVTKALAAVRSEQQANRQNNGNSAPEPKPSATA